MREIVDCRNQRLVPSQVKILHAAMHHLNCLVLNHLLAHLNSADIRTQLGLLASGGVPPCNVGLRLPPLGLTLKVGEQSVVW